MLTQWPFCYVPTAAVLRAPRWKASEFPPIVEGINYGIYTNGTHTATRVKSNYLSNMGDLTLNAEQNKPWTKKYTLHYSVYMKSKTRQSQSMVSGYPWRGNSNWKRGLSWVSGVKAVLFSCSRCWLQEWAQFVKIQWAVYFLACLYVHIFACQ